MFFSLGKAKLGRSGYWYSEVAYWLCCLCNAMFCRDLFSIWKEMEDCAKLYHVICIALAALIG